MTNLKQKLKSTMGKWVHWDGAPGASKLRGELMTGVGERNIRPLGTLDYQMGPLKKSQTTEPLTLETRKGSKLGDPGGFAYFIPLILKVAIAWG